jgi:nucleoside-diphosphate-sugar epimerase
VRVLIVGCGYVGVALGAELTRQAHEVFGLTRSERRQPELKAAGITPLRGDITRAEDLNSLPSNWDWVVNCVSSSGGTPEQYREVYLEGVRNLINRLAQAPPQKFVYTSSTGVYGQNDGSVVTETSPTEPVSETARILVQAEAALLQAVSSQRFPAVILRVSGIYGPGRGYWLKQFVNGQARINDDGQRIINMVHRDDVAGAIIAAFQTGEPGQICNVTDDEPVSQHKLFKWLSQALPRSLPALSSPEARLRTNRGATNKKVSNAFLKRRWGYRLKYPTFREGFAAEISGLAAS